MQQLELDQQEQQQQGRTQKKFVKEEGREGSHPIDCIGLPREASILFDLHRAGPYSQVVWMSRSWNSHQPRGWVQAHDLHHGTSQ